MALACPLFRPPFLYAAMPPAQAHMEENAFYPPAKYFPSERQGCRLRDGMVILIRKGAGYKKKSGRKIPAALFLSVFWLRDYYSTINSTWARRFNALPSLVSLSARGLDSP